MTKTPTHNGACDHLVNNLKSLIQGAESCLSSTGEDLKAAKETFERTLSSAKDEIIRYQDVVVGKTKQSAIATDEYVHENPWRSIAIGASVGLLVGVVLGRR
jgi:ElaB/YqjD/DUF883 family membrane-anchored ribosome-binding protein